MLPGPMPIFTASAPASISASAPSGVATLPAITCTALDSFLIALHRAQHAARVAVRGVDHDDVDLGRDQGARARASPSGPTPVAAATRSRPSSSLLASGWVSRLVHVLDGDQPDAAIGVVHHQQLLDPVAVQQAARLVRGDVGGDGDQVLARHQLVDLQASGRWRSGRRGW